MNLQNSVHKPSECASFVWQVVLFLVVICNVETCLHHELVGFKEMRAARWEKSLFIIVTFLSPTVWVSSRFSCATGAIITYNAPLQLIHRRNSITATTYTRHSSCHVHQFVSLITYSECVAGFQTCWDEGSRPSSKPDTAYTVVDKY